MRIFKEFTFDSAHFLPHVPDGHKCKEMHGHTYHLTLYFYGALDKNLGWIQDFGDIKKVVAPLISTVDHKVLNNIAGLENPTCEMMVLWFWDKIKPQIPNLSKVKLYETLTSGAVYEG